MERYARQTMIDGWDQGRLAETTLLVAGTGLLARLGSLLAAAMGFGRVVLLGDGRVAGRDRRFLLADVPEGASLVRTWAEALRGVNPEVEVAFVHDVPCGRSFGRIPRPDVILEASPHAVWKAQALRFAAQTGAGLVMAAAGPHVGLYCVGRSMCRDLLKFEGAVEDPLVALSLAALAVEEIRRLRLPLGPRDRPASGPVLVSPEALHRRAGGLPPLDRDGVSERHPDIALVGAGALGTWAGIGIGLVARSHVRLTVYDPDGIEATNLNRQVLFAGAINRPKAEVMAGRLSAMFPEIEAEGRIEAVTEGNLADACQADLVLCGPDNFAARALLHRGSLNYGVAVVNGGTSAFGGDVAVYVPGRSPCLACSLRVEMVARSVGEAERRARCAGVPEASVVTSNALIGALMAFEARAALAGRPARGIIEYDGQAQGCRLGVRSVREPCACGQAPRQLIFS